MCHTLPRIGYQMPYNKCITHKVPKMPLKKEIFDRITEERMNKTQILMNRIVQVDNFQNMACVCANFEEFVDELAEWGVDHAAGIDFDDPELDIPALDKFIKAENGYVREVA